MKRLLDFSKTRIELAVLFVLFSLCVNAKNDFASVSVPEESGIKFERITEDADCVQGLFGLKDTPYFGKGKFRTIAWWPLPELAVSPDGQRIGYIFEKNKSYNIMVKNATKGGASVQRTFRKKITGLSWSSDGNLCFTEQRDENNAIYVVNADKGNVIRQITTGSESSMGGVISPDCNTIFFHRLEGHFQYSLWSYDRNNNLFSNFGSGFNICPIPTEPNAIFCARFTSNNESEIWRVNFVTGVEEVILSQPGKSFTTPQLSPDGKWLLVVGSSKKKKTDLGNTDIYVVRTDGTQLTQLTYHLGNDLSPAWSPDGKSIYFLSQRGSAKKKYNVWRMNFSL